MLRDVKESHYWVFGQIYSVLAAFADDPSNVISCIGGGRIRVAEDQANDLRDMLRTITAHYPDAGDLEVIKVSQKVDKMLDERSLNGESFDPTFWTNDGFMRHSDWADIRDLAREFLIR